MKANMGGADRIIRFLSVAVIGVLYFANIITGTLAIVLLIVATIFIVTSFLAFCPMYAIFGINSCAAKKEVTEEGAV